MLRVEILRQLVSWSAGARVHGYGCWVGQGGRWVPFRETEG